MVQEITSSNFEDLVMKSDKPVVIDLWAEWCGPCRMLTPIMKEMAEEYDGKAVIGKVDVDSNPDIAAKYGVRNIPTVLYVKDGQLVDKQVGAVPKSTLTAKLDPLIG